MVTVVQRHFDSLKSNAAKIYMAWEYCLRSTTLLRLIGLISMLIKEQLNPDFGIKLHLFLIIEPQNNISYNTKMKKEPVLTF